MTIERYKSPLTVMELQIEGTSFQSHHSFLAHKDQVGVGGSLGKNGSMGGGEQKKEEEGGILVKEGE